jgi:hypothetical protein
MVFVMMYQLFILKSFMASRLIDPVTHYCLTAPFQILHVQLNVDKKSNCYYPLEHIWYMMYRSGKKQLKELHT